MYIHVHVYVLVSRSRKLLIRPSGVLSANDGYLGYLQWFITDVMAARTIKVIVDLSDCK